MEIEQAIRTLRALASGLDPEDSQPVEPGSFLLRPEVVRALNRALSSLVHEEERAKNKPANAGRYWSAEEDAKVCEEVRQGIAFHEIAKSHNRTVGSIVSRLVKLGQIVPKRPPKEAPEIGAR